MPVLLIRHPERVHPKQRCTSCRVSVSLRSRIEVVDKTRAADEQHAALTNRSGDGDQLYLRSIPPVDVIRLSMETPDSFLKEYASDDRGFTYSLSIAIAKP